MIIFIWKKIKTLSYFVFCFPWYKMCFGEINKKCRIVNPLKLDGMQNIQLKGKVIINYKTWLAAMPLTGEKNCELIIKDGSVIGHFNHIYATKSIVIEENVLTADKVYISDNSHDYSDPNVPIMKQRIIQKKMVTIGSGSWIGEHACIIGASVGKNSVIGANSVVTKDIPDYCVAAGIPAKIIKRYNFERKQWERTNSKGEFFVE